MTAPSSARGPRPLLLWLVPILGIMALAVVGGQLLTKPNDAQYRVVRKGNITHSFSCVGRVEAETTVEIAPKSTGRIVDVLVKEGEFVNAGQRLVKMDDSLHVAEHDEARFAAEAAKAHWDKTRNGPRSELVERAEQVVEELRGDLQMAEAKLEETIRGPRPEDLSQAESLAALAQAEQVYAAKQLERELELIRVESSTESQVDDLRRRHDVAQATLDSRKTSLERLKNGATKEEIQQARAAVRSAKARLHQAMAELNQAKTGATPDELRLAEAQYKRASATLRRVEASLAETELTSPVDGVVLRRYREPGDLAHSQQLSGTPILVIADTQQRLVRVEVTENDVYKVRVGQTATITSDGYSGRQWTGKVSRVALVMGKKALFSENPREKVDVRVLEAWITPDEPLHLPINLPVEARIIDEVRRDVLLVPAKSVDSSSRVRLADGTVQSVELGDRDDANAEVLSGLDEGDRVRID